jgi:sugar phosphate isomerase/epimerase
MRVDRLIEILSELPADSEVFCWLATQDDYEEYDPNLTPDRWAKVVAGAEEFADPYGQDLHQLIISTLEGGE